MFITEFPFKVWVVYDETNEKAEVPEYEWVTFARLNFQNTDILRQKYIREQLRALNNEIVKYDEFYYEKRKKEEEAMNLKEINEKAEDSKGLLRKKLKKKNKKSKLDEADDIDKPKEDSLQKFNLGLLAIKKDTLKVGTLRVETLIPDRMLVQGFKIFFDENNKKDSKSNTDKKTITFDASEISLNVKSFKFSKINVLIKMNEDKIKDDTLQNNNEKKINNRYETTFKRHLDEITLSNLFIDFVYDDPNVTLLDIFRYFLKFEKRKKIKLFPYLHIEGLLFISNLWELCSSDPIQGFWYIYFLNLWFNNKSQIESIGNEKFFNPDSKYSLCYYAMSRQVNIILI